jgi:hypothetical protein
MAQLTDKNSYLAELTNQKMQIESKLRGQVDPAAITDMQRQLEDLTEEFERVIKQRIDQRRLMIEELTKATSAHDQLNQAHEDIRRVKNAIDLA